MIYDIYMHIYIYICIYIIYIWAGRSTRWNQDCWEDINNLRYTDDTTLKAESEEELKSLLMKVKGEWKSWLKAQHSEN